MTLLVTLVGAVLILATLRYIFHELFHPSGTGSASGALSRAIWRLFRRLAERRPGALPLAGPVALVAILLSWAASLAIGWALLYWPYLPGGFLLQTGLDPRAQGGFGLLTAGITWVLSIYPALSRRRSLAQQVTVLRDAESESGIDVVESHAETAEQIFRSLAVQLLAVRSDLQQFSITYFFHSSDERSALSAALPYLARLAERSGDPSRPPRVQLGSAVLRRSLDDFAATVAPTF